MKTAKTIQMIAGTVAAVFIAGSVSTAGGVQWHESLAAAKQAAVVSSRPVLVEFHSTGCGPCARMEQETLGDPEVAAAIAESFEAVRVHGLDQAEIATQYLVSFYPTVKFMDASGRVIYDLQGFIPPADFLQALDLALEAHTALQRARASSTEDPADAEGALAIARDFYAARQHAEAADWARRASEVAEDDSGVRGEAQYVLGAALADAGEPGRAEQPLIESLGLADGADWQWDARLKLGYVWLQRGEEDSGIGMLQTVHASDEAPEGITTEAARLLTWWGVDVD